MSEHNEEHAGIEANEIEEVVELTDDMPPPQDDEEMGEDDHIVIDLANNSWTYMEHEDSVFVVERHPKLPMVVTGAADHTAKLWTTHKQPPVVVATFNHNESVVAAKFTNDGSYVITGDMAGLVQVHKTRNGEKWTEVARIEEVEEVVWIATHPTQPYFAFGAVDGSVWAYAIESDGVTPMMTGYSHEMTCNYGEFLVGDESIQLVTVSDDGSVVNWNVATGQANYKLTSAEFRIESPWVVASANGNLVAVGGRDGNLAIINNDNHKIVHATQVLHDSDDQVLSIEAISWCKGLPLLAVGVVHGDVFVFETQQWRLRRQWATESHEDYENAITHLQFERESPMLVGSSTNGKIYKWDARTGNEAFCGVGHNMPVLDFAVMDDGKLITAGDEGVSLVFMPDA
ncbi:ribosome assembly protein Sqt1p [Diutina catenulata]